MIKRLLSLLLLVLAQGVSATTYYVRTDGNNGNSGTANSAGGAWFTVDFAAGAASDGDIVRVQGGTYPEVVTPNVSGVTFVADNTVVIDGIDFVTGLTRIRFIGFIIDPGTTGSQQNGCVNFEGTTSFLEFWNCEIRNGADAAFRGGVGILSEKLIIVGCNLHDFGTLLDPGSAKAFVLSTDDGFFMANEISDGRPDGIICFGDRNRWLSTYIWGLSEVDGGHTDAFQTGGGGNSYGWEGNLYESTFYVAGGAGGDEHVSNFSNGQDNTEPMLNNIFRHNVWHNTGSGGIGINQTDTEPITKIYIYNNTEVDGLRQYPTIRYFDVYSGAQTDEIYHKNNIHYETWGTGVSSGLEVVLFDAIPIFEFDYNLAFDPDGSVTYAASWTAQVNEQSNVNPNFVDKPNDDFRLGSSSGAQNTAGPLTTVTSVSGSGTAFTVDNAGYFRGDNATLTQYGGNLVKGDTITVGTDVLEIASIAGDTITVTSSFTWAQNDLVYFGSDTTPDIGAYPFGYTFLSSATYSVNAGTATVEPNTTARMVIQFRDAIPIAVDNSSPYTFSHTAGDTYTVYALYPQPTLKVEASEGAAGGGGGATYGNKGRSFRGGGAVP